MRAVTLSILAFAVLNAHAAEGPKLTSGPEVTRKGGMTAISFAVDRETDVTVAILDAEGRVVRHLAGGRLGANAPEPLQPNALQQKIDWDGKDDDGKEAAEGSRGPFRVRVQAGLQPALDSFMLYNPDASPAVKNLAIGPKGEVYAFYQDPTANSNQGGVKIKVLDRHGKHLRQILPFPADLPYDRVKASGAFQDEQGRIVPHLHNWHSLNFYPDPVLARGRSISPYSTPAVDREGRVFWMAGGMLAALDADGGLPYETFLSPPIDPQQKLSGHLATLALSSDGKYLYAGGLAKCVYRIEIATRKAEVFVGKPDQDGASGGLFTQPRGVAAAQGKLYVADPAAGRVAVFDEADRKLVGEIKAIEPQIVQVHPETGAVYVCCHVPEAKPNKDGKPRTKDAWLHKFSNFQAEKPQYSLALPTTGQSPNDGTHRIALDASGEQPLLWAPGLPYARSGSRIACYRDTGSAFESVELQAEKGPWANGPRDLLMDRRRGDLYVKVQGERWHQLDERTGEFKRTVQFPKNDGAPYSGSHGANLGLDADGNYITHCWGKGRGMMRWSPDLKPLNWEGMDTHRTEWGGMMTFQLNYLTMLGNEIYLIKRNVPYALEVFDLGLNKKRRVVWNARCGSVPRVDAKGNIYITVPIRPIDRDFPEFFDGKLEKNPDYYGTIGEKHYWYTYMYGSIVKFSAEGGAFHWIETEREKNDLTGLPAAIAAKPKVKQRYFQNGRYPNKECEVQGAEWIRYGFCPYSETYSAGTPVCMCEGAGFDVDPYGRIFYPNLGQFRIEVIDTNNNEIGRFGAYGNQDSGPDGRIRTPEIPLAWPTYVAVSDTHAYINDTINLRVVKVKLNYADEKTAELK